MKDSAWKLKVLSGSHQGVEVELPVGKTTLGSDDLQSDLVLENQGLEGIHLAFEQSQEKTLFAVLEAKSSAAFIDDDPWPQGEKTEISGSAVIETEGLQIAVAEKHQPWPEVKEKEKKSNKSREKPVGHGEEEKKNRQADAVAVDPAQVSGITIAGLSLRAIIALTVGLVVMILGLALILSERLPETTPQQTLTLLEQGRSIPRELHLNDVRVTSSKNRRGIIVSGYVNTEYDKRQLLAKLKRQGISYSGRVWVVERIVRSVRFSLEELGFDNIHANAGKEAGTVVLKGFADDRSRWPDLEVMLDSDIPGLRSWKVHFSSPSDRMETFSQLLDDEGIDDKLKLQRDGDTIQALGQLDSKEEKDFYSAAEKFRQLYGVTPQLVVYPRPLASSSLPVKAINLSDTPFIVMENNQKYLIGAKLPNGYQLDKITRKGITMSKGSDTVYFSLESNNDEARTHTDDPT